MGLNRYNVISINGAYYYITDACNEKVGRSRAMVSHYCAIKCTKSPKGMLQGDGKNIAAISDLSRTQCQECGAMGNWEEKWRLNELDDIRQKEKHGLVYVCTECGKSEILACMSSIFEIGE